MKTLITFLVFLSASITSCASSNKARYIDTELNTKGHINSAQVGIDSDNNIVVQEEVHADAELQQIEYENLNLYDKSKSLVKRVVLCRTDLADPRLGGSGELPAERTFDIEPTVEKYREEIGLDSNGQLKVVKKSMFIEKRNALKRLNEKLSFLHKKLERQVDECLWEMGVARRKVGLPGKWYPEENSLDDAFAILSRHKDVTNDIEE